MSLLIHRLHSLFHPDEFQGWGKKQRYFEGWYFKIISSGEKQAFAFIPGIAMDENGGKHAFIQVLDGKNKTATYHKFDISEFRSEPRKFAINIGRNTFSSSGISVHLTDIEADITFSGWRPWPSKWYSPGIMGPYSFVPYMECYHGILSMDHQTAGKIRYQENEIDFSGGRGYTEKDWGSSFPSAYFWMQSNHFSTKETSIKLSVAKIPWLGSSFTGFIGGLWYNNRLYQFTTYNGTRLIRSFADNEKVEITLRNKKYQLEIVALREKSTLLISPIRGFMEGKIEESMTAQTQVKLTGLKTHQVIFEDIGRSAGLEVAGAIETIFI